MILVSNYVMLMLYAIHFINAKLGFFCQNTIKKKVIFAFLPIFEAKNKGKTIRSSPFIFD